MNGQFEPDRMDRGRKYRLDLEIEAHETNVRIPVLLARGATPGRRLVATAAVHGDEFEGVRTIFEVFDSLDTDAMTGDFLAIPVANPPAFWSGTRLSPLDGENLARLFPGREDSGVTAAIAYHLDRHVLSAADFYIDLHSGGLKYEIPLLVGYDATDPCSRAAAFAFGAPIIWGHSNISPGRSLCAAKERGIPFLYTEGPGGGRIASGDLLTFRRGIENLLRHLRILPGEANTVAPEWHLVGDGDIDNGLQSPVEGFLVPRVSVLERVVKGQELGVVLNLHGVPIARLHSPRDGIVVMVHAFPVVAPGEPLFLLAEVHP